MENGRSRQRRTRRRAILILALSLVALVVLMIVTGGRYSRRGDLSTDRALLVLALVVTVAFFVMVVGWVLNADRRIRDRYGAAVPYAGLTARTFTTQEKAALHGFRQRLLLAVATGGVYGTVVIEQDGVRCLPGPTASAFQLPATTWRWEDVDRVELGENGLNQMMSLSLYPKNGEPVRLTVNRGGDAREALERLAPSVFNADKGGWYGLPSR